MTLEAPPTSILKSGSLFLDFDGTLVNFAKTPEEVRLERALIPILLRLHKLLGGRLAILSGRSLANVRDHLSPLNLAVAGSHGLERAHATASVTRETPPARLNMAVEFLRKFAADRPGVMIEEKPMSVALHYRAAPAAEAECVVAVQNAATTTGLVIQPGNMVLELKPACGDKGTALEQFMMEAPFTGSRPIFIGDDLTDEHGFLAARRFGGAGVIVGSRSETVASYALADVAAVHQWLQQASEDLA